MPSPAGIVSHTGVAGLTLGGGIGWLMRKHGLTIDNLARRRRRHRRRPIRCTRARRRTPSCSGGCAAAAATSGSSPTFEFRLHPVGPIVLAGPIYWPMDSSRDVLRFYRDWIADAPDELTTIVFHRTAPTCQACRPNYAASPSSSSAVASGPDRRRRGSRPAAQQFGSPLRDLCTPMPFLALQTMLDPSFLHGWQYYIRSATSPNSQTK